jgi:predicted Zn finger-like uncharacterized protein
MLRTLCVAAMVASYAPRRRPAVARPVCAHQRRSLLRYATDAETDEDVQHIITCGSCKAVYAIDKEILGKGAGAKVQCEVCGNVWFQATARVNTCVEIKSLRRVLNHRVVLHAIDARLAPDAVVDFHTGEHALRRL